MNKTNRNKSVYLALFAVFCFALNPSIALSFTGQLPLKAEDGSISITVPECTDDTKALHFSGVAFTCADIAVGTGTLTSITGTSPISAATVSGATTISLSTAGAWSGNAATATLADTVETNATLTGDVVTSTGNATAIADGVIINTDIKSDANIDYSKMDAGTVPTWNQSTTGNAATATLAATVTTNATLSGDVVTSTGNATAIADGVIVNTDIKSDANIDYSKMDAGTVPTWNQATTGTAKASATVFFTTQTKLSTGVGTLYGGLSGVLSSSETDVQVPIPQGTYKNLTCRASAAPGAATTVSFGTNTCGTAASTGQITVTILATGVAAIANTSNTRSITTDGQCGAIKIVKPSGYATSGYISCSIERH
jgi:lipopolysaccharide export system protein LptA